MKRLLLFGLCILLCLPLGCSKNQKETELTVFAAASLQDTLTELSRQYMAENDVNVIFNFDSSGTL